MPVALMERPAVLATSEMARCETCRTTLLKMDGTFFQVGDKCKLCSCVLVLVSRDEVLS